MKRLAVSRTGMGLIAALALSISMVPSGVSANPVDDAPGAFSSNLQDQLNGELGYASYLVGAPAITCNPRVRKATGTPQRTVNPVGVLFARDVAYWSVQCSSVDEPLPSYDLELRIAFQYYANGQWNEITETRKDCKRPSSFGQAAIIDCINEFTYPIGHVSAGRYHRARFKILQPYNLPPFFSDPWLMLNADAIT